MDSATYSTFGTTSTADTVELIVTDDHNSKRSIRRLQQILMVVIGLAAVIGTTLYFVPRRVKFVPRDEKEKLALFEGKIFHIFLHFFHNEKKC